MTAIQTFDDGFGPIVELEFANGRLHVLETFGADTPWTPETGRVTRRETDGTRTTFADGLDFRSGWRKGRAATCTSPRRATARAKESRVSARSCASTFPDRPEPAIGPAVRCGGACGLWVTVVYNTVASIGVAIPFAFVVRAERAEARRGASR